MRVETRSEQRVGFTGGIRNIPGSLTSLKWAARRKANKENMTFAGIARVQRVFDCPFSVGIGTSRDFRERTTTKCVTAEFICRRELCVFGNKFPSVQYVRRLRVAVYRYVSTPSC